MRIKGPLGIVTARFFSLPLTAFIALIRIFFLHRWRGCKSRIVVHEIQCGILGGQANSQGLNRFRRFVRVDRRRTVRFRPGVIIFKSRSQSGQIHLRGPGIVVNHFVQLVKTRRRLVVLNFDRRDLRAVDLMQIVLSRYIRFLSPLLHLTAQLEYVEFCFIVRPKRQDEKNETSENNQRNY